MTKSRLELLGLTILAVGPMALLGVLAIARTEGSDFSAILRISLIIFLGVRILFVAAGTWRRRLPWLLGGTVNLASVVLSAYLGLSGMWWIGGKTIELIVVVLDDETNHPIPGASVRFSGDELAAKVTSDENGVARLNDNFMTYGTFTLVRDTGYIQLWRRTLEVEAKGYPAVKFPLESSAVALWDLYSLPVPPVEVRLKKEHHPL